MLRFEHDARESAGKAEIRSAAFAIANSWISEDHIFARAELAKQITALVLRFWGGPQELTTETGGNAGQRYFDLRNS